MDEESKKEELELFASMTAISQPLAPDVQADESEEWSDAELDAMLGCVKISRYHIDWKERQRLERELEREAMRKCWPGLSDEQCDYWLDL